MAVEAAAVLDALKVVRDPDLNRDIVSLGFIKDLLEAVPGSRDVTDAVNGHISSGSLYKALKEIRKLMKREQELAPASA